MSDKNWYWGILKRFWMWKRLTVHLLHGQDQHCLMIKWFSGQEQKYVSTQIPFYAWRSYTKNQLAGHSNQRKFFSWRMEPIFFVCSTLSFSMFSCSHFCVIFFLTIRFESKSDMSKRGQETTSNEGSPVAKARPRLVARDPKSEEISSQSLRYLVNPVNADERKEVEIAPGISWRSASRSEIGYSQASRQEKCSLALGNSWREEQLQKRSDDGGIF